jgi:cytochrome c-type biogenesis protein
VNHVALAFAAGVLSFATPCVLPLVPGYLAALTGSVPGTGGPGAGRRALLAAIPFVLGFACVFIVLGVAAGLLGSAMRGHRDELTMASGILVVAIGFALLGLIPVPALERWLAPALGPARRSR